MAATSEAWQHPTTAAKSHIYIARRLVDFKSAASVADSTKELCSITELKTVHSQSYFLKSPPHPHNAEFSNLCAFQTIPGHIGRCVPTENRGNYIDRAEASSGS